MKRFVWVALLVLSLGLVSACGGGGAQQPAGQSGGEQKTTTIGLAISTLNNPFFVDLRDGAQAAADAAGFKLVVLDAQDDPSAQVSQIEDLITQKVDVILINPTDSDAVVPAVEQANQAGIPVITVDRSSNGGKVVTHIASDNVAGGKMAGEYLLELIGKKGNIVELEGVPGASATRDRGEGFHQAVDGVADVKVVAKQTANFNRNEGLEVMENILQANPDIVGVFAHNDEMALGALEAITAAGKADQIKVVGFDATDDAVAAVKEGRMAGTIAQKPKEMGKLAVEAAQKVIAGQSVDEFIPVPLELVK